MLFLFALQCLLCACVCVRRKFSMRRNSTCNIFIDNVFVFELEGNLACARFVSQCHVVVGNLVICAKRKYARFFDLAMLLLEICT